MYFYNIHLHPQLLPDPLHLPVLANFIMSPHTYQVQFVLPTCSLVGRPFLKCDRMSGSTPSKKTDSSCPRR